MQVDGRQVRKAEVKWQRGVRLGEPNLPVTMHAFGGELCKALYFCGRSGDCCFDGYFLFQGFVRFLKLHGA